MSEEDSDDDSRTLSDPACITLEPDEAEADTTDCDTEQAGDERLVTVSEVQAILGPSGSRIPEVVSESDEDELNRIKAFTCHCQHYKEGPCYRQFTPEFVLKRRLEMKSSTEGLHNKHYHFNTL